MLRGLTESFKLLTLPCWTRSTPSFAPPGECAELDAAAITLLDEVYAFLCAARWRAWSWSWTAVATTLLDEVYAFLCSARRSEWSWSGCATTLLDEKNCSAPSPSRVLCCLLCLTFAEKTNRHGKTRKWPDTHRDRFPPGRRERRRRSAFC